VAKRRDAPAEVLRALADDSEHWVRFFVACNPATPDDVLERLRHDPRRSVRTMTRRSRRRLRSTALFLGSERSGPPPR